MHRLFLALRLPPELRAACLAAMEDGPRGWAWQSAEQLHLTIRFIGEVDRTTANDLALALERIRAPTVSIALRGTGWFDHGAKGALFARAVPKDALAALHDKADRLLVQFGLAPDRRAYVPHITLARRRPGGAAPEHWLSRTVDLRTDSYPIRHLTLFESRRSGAGPSYETILRVPLRD